MLAFIIMLAATIVVGCGPKNSKSASFLKNDASVLSYRDTKWPDGRPKLIFDPKDQPQGLTGETLVRAWIKLRANTFQVEPTFKNLRLLNVRRSSGGIHYIYVTPDGVGVVKDSVLMVSLTLDGTRIYRAFNGITSKPVDEVKIQLTKAEAIEKAWQHLKPTGKLLHEPTAELQVQSVGGVRQTWWRVMLDVTAPAGSWEYLIDPKSGAVVSQTDSRTYKSAHSKFTRTVSHSVHPTLAEAMREWKPRASKKTSSDFLDTPPQVDGQAKLFVIDPFTALNDPKLNDDSAPASFANAYETRTLSGIQKGPDGYQLAGPRAIIDDWDAPFVAVTKSPDGNWNFERGNNGFTDAMTWWHIDQAQQLLERMGFVGESRIFRGALVADSNGAGMADNSYFSPDTGLLSFGHGCIDDNEDPDVILHEMGHAIQYSINPWWSGGDAGAMGEGFGDYWAVSYGYRDPRSRERDPFKVFNWDGSSGCWDGRRVDRMTAQYRRGETYQAHGMHQEFVDDELWSTPLTQTMNDLVQQGIPMDEIDRVVIESQFGLAQGVTMPDWANALVQTASILYPNGPHAQVFAARFSRQMIMTPPSPWLVSKSFTISNTGNNHVPDPGENVNIDLTLQNIGDLIAEDVTATLTSRNSWATVTNGPMSYGDIAEGALATMNQPFSVSIDPKAPCGQRTALEATVADSKGNKTIVPVDFNLGILGGETWDYKMVTAVAIPDKDSAGLTSTITIADHEGITINSQIRIDVNITHPVVTDLKIALVSPSGREIILKSFLTGQRTDTGIRGTYPVSLTPVEDLESLNGSPVNGTWSLRVVDGFESATGTLNSWGLSIPTGNASCEKPQ